MLSQLILLKHCASVLLRSQLPLQSLVLAFVVTSDDDDDDKHQDQQPPGSGPHDEHQHVLAHSGLGFCAVWKRGWGD